MFHQRHQLLRRARVNLGARQRIGSRNGVTQVGGRDNPGYCDASLMRGTADEQEIGNTRQRIAKIAQERMLLIA